MISVTAAGRIGKDAETRKVGTDTVTGFSLSHGEKKKDGTWDNIWLDCSIFGKRGQALEKYLKKGGQVTVVGSLTKREKDGKTYLGVRVDHIELQGKGSGESSGSAPASGSNDLPQDNSGGGDDDIPF